MDIEIAEHSAKFLCITIKALVIVKADPVVALGDIIFNIPFIDRLDKSPLKYVRAGDPLKVNADKGRILYMINRKLMVVTK